MAIFNSYVKLPESTLFCYSPTHFHGFYFYSTSVRLTIVLTLGGWLSVVAWQLLVMSIASRHCQVLSQILQGEGEGFRLLWGPWHFGASSQFEKTETSKSPQRKIKDVYSGTILYDVDGGCVPIFWTSPHMFKTVSISLVGNVTQIPLNCKGRSTPHAGQRFLSQLSTVNLQLATFLGLLAVAVSGPM